MSRKGNRWAIYAAEDEILDGGGTYASVEAMQLEVDTVMRSRWWAQLCVEYPVRHCRVVYPVAGRWSGAWLVDDNVGELRIRPRSACGMTICHELTHFTNWKWRRIKGTRADEKDHDPVFASNYLAVVLGLLGASYRDQLLAAYEKHEVKRAV